MVASDLHKCTLANLDEGSFFIDEPTLSEEDGTK